MKRVPCLLVLATVLSIGRSAGQTVSVIDTIYTPSGDSQGAWPATVFVPAVTNGIGAVLVHGSGVTRQTTRGWCDSLAAYGYIAMAIEYPDAQPYPRPVRAVKLAVQFLRRNAARFGITTNKIVGLGQSMGSIAWGEAMIWDNDFRFFQTDSTVSDHLDAAILLYGAYDPEFDNPDWRPYFGDDSTLFLKGNCLKHIANITTPVLLLHGTGDQTVQFVASVKMYDSLIAYGKTAELVPFNSLPHGFDFVFPGGTLTQAGVIALDSALTFLRRTVAPALKIRLSTSSIDFGSLLLTAADSAGISIDNIGSSTLGLKSISHSASAFTLSNLPSMPAAIPPGGSLRFTVAYHPALNGIAHDTVAIESDDSLHPVTKISLRGKGVASVTAARGGILYAASAGTPEGFLMSMNRTDGAVDTIGPMGVPDIRSMAIRHADRLIYGAATTAAPTGVYEINGATGEVVLAGRLPVGNLSALAFSRGDSLYGTTTTGTFYRIDLASGHADSLGTAAGLAYSGLAFQPGSGRLWASVRSPIDSIFRLDRNTGNALFIGTTGFNALTASIAFDTSGRLYGLIDNGSGEDYLAVIDTQTAAGSIIAGPLSAHNLHAIATAGDAPATSAPLTAGGSTPPRFALAQNYPNPFNPSTTIRFSVPQRTRVLLSVFNTLGQEVTRIVEGELEAGPHEVRFDAGNLASGVYFYRLQAAAFTQVRAMAFVR